jgi:hypothetical protein
MIKLEKTAFSPGSQVQLGNQGNDAFHKMTLFMKSITKDQDDYISETPPVWMGFVFVAVLFLLELFILYGKQITIIYLYYIIGGISILYWLAYIYRFHTILGELSGSKYPISPSASVGWHFLPIYNIFWIFYWPSELSHFIKKQNTVDILPGVVIGALIFISFISFKIDGPLGLLCLSTIDTYISNRINRHIEKLCSKHPNGIPTVVLEDYD